MGHIIEKEHQLVLLFNQWPRATCLQPLPRRFARSARPLLRGSSRKRSIYFVFESEEALAAFAENPDHLAAAARIKPYISGRACLDIAD